MQFDRYKTLGRDYQIEDLEQSVLLHRHRINRQLLVWPTGVGKTHFSSLLPMHPYYGPLIRKYGMIFVNHRREILYQSMDRFRSMHPDLSIEIEMGENEASGFADINFMCTESVGRETSERLMQKYQNFHPAVIVVDEAHHLKEDGSFDNTLNWFGAGSFWHEKEYTIPGTDIKPLSLMLTATPEMPDGRSYHKWIDPNGIVAQRDILWAIRNGWLTDIRQFSSHSDAFGRDNALEMEIDGIVKLYHERLRGKKTLIFARNVPQSQLLAQTFNQTSYKCGHVDAETPPEERAETFAKFADREYMILTNRLVCTEGWDDKGIQALINVSNSKSRTLELQKLGRGLRPSADANIDQYDTPEERRIAIRQSSKPYLEYYTIGTPEQHNMNLVVTISDMDVNVNASDDERTVFEIIELIENVIEEQPERNISDLSDLDDILIEVREHNIWDRSVYNAHLPTITPLRWVEDASGGYAIYMEGNPWSDRPLDFQDTIYWLRPNESGTHDAYQVLCGGYNHYKKRAMREQMKLVREDVDYESEIKRFDNWLSRSNEVVYKDCRIGSAQPALSRDKKYLKNKGIKFNPNITERSALYLMDAARVEHKENRLWK